MNRLLLFLGSILDLVLWLVTPRPQAQRQVMQTCPGCGIEFYGFSECPNCARKEAA